MNIRKLKVGDESLLEVFLINYTETSMFLRSNLRAVGLTYKDKPYHGDYFASFADDGSINGVIAHFWNGNIMMQAPDDEILDSLVSALQRNIIRPVCGVMGEKKQARLTLSSLGLLNEAFELDIDDVLLKIELKNLKVSPKYDVNRMRMVKASSLNEGILFDWLKAYEQETLNALDCTETDDSVKRRISNIQGTSDCWALEFDGKPVCLSGFNARLPDIVQVGPVWTPVEHRNKGYARVLLALTLEKAKKEGVNKSILFTDNPAATKAYNAVGYENIGFYTLAFLKKPINL